MIRKLSESSARRLVRKLSEEMEQLALPGIDAPGPGRKKTKMEELVNALGIAKRDLAMYLDDLDDARQSGDNASVSHMKTEIQYQRDYIREIEQEMQKLKAEDEATLRMVYGGDPRKNPRGLGT